jgi:hypothetical protein
MVSTLGRFADSGEYVFFAADSQHPNHELIGNVINSQKYVPTYAQHHYPVTEACILHRGDDAWNAALNTVKVGTAPAPESDRDRPPRALCGSGDRCPVQPPGIRSTSTGWC